MKEYIAMLKNYANFKDRTNVKGYWMVFLINIIISIPLSIITVLVPTVGMIITGIYCLALIVPSLALAIRRLRDGGKKWTYIFINLIPIAGPILYLIQLIKPSVPDNGVPTV
ncbi:MAG: DUF805 domain-containing protein [Defluviitaleaceae bacterium]|nr:DUF805 domain-containing protein [Defluviitaleaceae bacterium]